MADEIAAFKSIVALEVGIQAPFINAPVLEHATEALMRTTTFLGSSMGVSLVAARRGEGGASSMQGWQRVQRRRYSARSAATLLAFISHSPHNLLTFGRQWLG
jgi:hypothetical protein